MWQVAIMRDWERSVAIMRVGVRSVRFSHYKRVVVRSVAAAIMRGLW